MEKRDYKKEFCALMDRFALEKTGSLCCVWGRHHKTGTDERSQNMENEADIRFQLDILRRDGYHAAARIIESMQGKVSREAEMKYLKEFARQGCFDEEVSRDQLRCLWTAYCFHHRLDADTFGYDNDLFDLWNTVAEDEAETADWSNYESFNSFMCRYLV